MTKCVLLSMAVASAAWAGAPADELPMPLKFSVTAPGANDALLAGDLVLLPNHGSSVTRSAAKGRSRQEVTFDLKALEGGLYLVRAHWQDITEDGEVVRWEPAFMLKRTASAEARLDFPGGARVLKLTAG